jgi:hypothetical protein
MRDLNICELEMCFFDQNTFICGDFKWTHFSQQCLKEYRIGETCGLKLVMRTTYLNQKCENCERLQKKISRFWKEEQRIMRWKTYNHGSENAQHCIARSRTASIGVSKRILQDLRRNILKLQKTREYPFASFDCGIWRSPADGQGVNIADNIQNNTLPSLKIIASSNSSLFTTAEAEPFPSESNSFTLRLLELEAPGDIQDSVEDEKDADKLLIDIWEQERLAFILTVRLLYVAFESSISPDGTVHLLSGTILSSSRYPGISQRIFNYIHTLKTHLLHAGLSSQLSEADAEIEEWLPRVINALRSIETNIEDEPLQLQRLLATLREIKSQIRATGFRKIQLAPGTKET